MTPYEAASIAAATDSNVIAIVAVCVAAAGVFAAAAIAIVGFIVIFRQGKTTNGALAVLANQGEALKAQGVVLEALLRRIVAPSGVDSDQGTSTAEPAPEPSGGPAKDAASAGRGNGQASPVDIGHDTMGDCGAHTDRRDPPGSPAPPRPAGNLEDGPKSTDRPAG